MLKFNILQINDHDKRSLHKFMSSQEKDIVELQFPKHTIAGTDSNQAVFLNYLLITYIGQHLSKLTNQFGYIVPDAYTDDPFVFHLQIAETDTLVEALFEIAALISAFEKGQSLFTTAPLLLLKNIRNKKYGCAVPLLLDVAFAFKEKVRKK